jgi:hypothetical protein
VAGGFVWSGSVTRNQFVIYALLLTALIVLSEVYGSPRAFNIHEMFNWATR